MWGKGVKDTDRSKLGAECAGQFDSDYDYRATVTAPRTMGTM
jgi:hypothetical protein